MYGEVFCKVYNEFGWNYYPEVFGEQLLLWLRQNAVQPATAMDLACGTGILCGILRKHGIAAEGMDFSAGMIAIARENDPAGHYEVADMVTFCPERRFDLVTCTGDAVNHIAELRDVERIFRNVYAYTAPGGYFIFDLLNEREVSDSEPFETDFTDRMRVWFQMTRPAVGKVNLCIRVYEDGVLSLEENIRETVHDPQVICAMLNRCGFRVIKCADRLPDDGGIPGTTWNIIAQKPI